MEPFPDVTDLPGDAGFEGHLWLREEVTGLPLRLQMRSDGQLRFGDRKRAFDSGSIPLVYRSAVREVRTALRRDAFREAVEDVSSVTVYGVATCFRGLAYDWGRLPAFLVTDVHAAGRGGLLAPDAVEQSADLLGLTAAPAVEKERRADAFDPARATFPESAYADAAVAGLDVADKHGARGRLANPDVTPPADPGFEDAAAAARALVTPERRADGDVERTIDRVLRQCYGTLRAAGIDPETKAFRSAVAQAVQRAGD